MHRVWNKCTTWVIFFVTIFASLRNQSFATSVLSSEPNSNNTITEIRHDTSHLQFHHIRYIWTVCWSHVFDRKFQGSTNLPIKSPTFSAATNDKFKWYLKIDPHERNESTFRVSINLSPDSGKGTAWMKFEIVILDDNLNEVCDIRCSATSTFHEIAADTPGWSCDNFPKKSKDFFNDKMSISLNLTFFEDIPYNSSQHPNVLEHTRKSSNSSFNENVAHQTSHSSVPEHNSTDTLASLLYKNREYPDVMLFVNETRHPAHKDVLSLGSSVFAAMFKSAQENGKKIKRVNITDLNDQVVDEMLRYIYTGKCENLTNLADGLLVAAQKYNLTRLRTNCVDALSRQLSVENAANTLLLAEKNGADELKSNAIRFIAGNYEEVSGTVDWKLLVKSNPEYLHEVCQVLSKNNLNGDKTVQKICSI